MHDPKTRNWFSGICADQNPGASFAPGGRTRRDGMANRDKTRIEPTFDGPSRTKSRAGLSVSEDDRVLPRQRRPAASKHKSAKSARGRTRKRRGLFGGFARLFYWCFVLAIWGGIAAAGIVAWYGAQMPSATTWAIPDRSPN